jgi:DNA polymerase III epsilon subunit-like protein
MLSVDCEMTGLDPNTHAIVSIGAVDLRDKSRTFYGECRVFEGAQIDNAALGVNGFTREECLDENKQSQEVLLNSFLEWVYESENYTLVGQNVAFDRLFLNKAFERCGIEFAFSHRVVDVHSIAYAEFLRTGRAIPVRGEKTHTSTLNLDEILQYVGIPEEPRPHNALTGAKVSAEAFHRLIYRKNYLSDFEQFSIPDHLL